MNLTFLGTGTSTGVPQIGCHCPTCSSTDPRDKRLRCSVLVETLGRRLLIDCGPDLRTQMLTHKVEKLSALLITHSHYDHVGGIDDLRPYCKGLEDGFPTYCQSDVAYDLRMRVPYCFKENPYPGVPRFDIKEITAGNPFFLGKLKIQPLRIWHYKLPILGFRISKMAYITDAKIVPYETIRAIRKVDTLVINALRPKEHMSHLSLHEALDIIKQVQPRQAFLTHMSHDMPPHATMELPPGVYLAYDGLKIKF